MDWLTITVGAIFLIGVIVGIYRGAIRIAVSLATTILTLVVVVFATPYVVDLVEKYTPIETMIQQQVNTTMKKAAAAQISGGDPTTGMTEDGVRQVLGAAGVTEEKLESYGISIEDIVDGKVTGQQLAEFGISQNILDGIKNNASDEQAENALESAEGNRDLQVAAIEKADIPDIFKSLLTTNNNNEIYSKLGVDTFTQYVGQFLSKLIINILAFMGTFIFITIIVRAIVFALNIVSELPVLGFFNRILGGVVGAGCALIVVWVVFVIITMLYVTTFGKTAYTTIQSNEIMKMIYDYNPIMQLAVRFK